MSPNPLSPIADIPCLEGSNSHSIAALLELLRPRQTFLITSHRAPDGDAIGSSLALMHLLEAMGKQVVVALADPIAANFDCLAGVELIRRKLPIDLPPPDVAIFLECDRVERSGFSAEEFASVGAGLTVNIDHHLSGRPFADFNWIDSTACAVGAMLYEFACAAGLPLSPTIADCLYTAILTDTGSFNYPATQASTFAMAEQLVRSGTNANRIAQAMFFSNPPGKLNLLGTILSKMQIQGPLCWSCITRRDLLQAGATDDDSEGAVNYLISIYGICGAALFRETSTPGEYRISLRGKGAVDVSVAAASFGGGGHLNAAGCSLRGSEASVVERVLAELRKACHVAGPTALPTPALAPPPHPAQSTLLA